jgi:hypothetical protein
MVRMQLRVRIHDLVWEKKQKRASLAPGGWKYPTPTFQGLTLMAAVDESSK